jgi:hypothetical protein
MRQLTYEQKKHMPQYQATHIWQNTCHTIRQLTYKKNTCHNIRQLPYEKTHATISDNSLTYAKTTHTTLKDDSSHMKNTCHNIRQLTYEKKPMPQYQTTHIWKQPATLQDKHMPHYKTTHIFKGGHATVWDNSHMKKKHATS